MHIFRSKNKFSEYRKSLDPTLKVGFVPTMGALHQGHLSLFQKSIQENDITIGSIFVNPTQFDNAEDLEKYPMQLESDAEMLESIGVKALFAPSTEDMYPKGLELETIPLHGLDQVMEGAHRAGHFQGVVTIVKRLFEIVLPHSAYFGEKDYQQLQIIRLMNEELNMKINIVGMPILREANGLAMSSRNMRLTDYQKDQASIIYKTLEALKHKTPYQNPIDLLQVAYKNFAYSSLRLEYCTIAHAKTLQEVQTFEKGEDYRVFIAAYCGEVRLIDNSEIL